ncbi:MAG: hypothetical protein ACK5B9_05200, partial [Flavobacteriia bacterium]
MKNIYLVLLFLISSFGISAQQSWENRVFSGFSGNDLIYTVDNRGNIFAIWTYTPDNKHLYVAQYEPINDSWTTIYDQVIYGTSSIEIDHRDGIPYFSLETDNATNTFEVYQISNGVVSSIFAQDITKYNSSTEFIFKTDSQTGRYFWLIYDNGTEALDYINYDGTSLNIYPIPQFSAVSSTNMLMEQVGDNIWIGTNEAETELRLFKTDKFSVNFIEAESDVNGFIYDNSSSAFLGDQASFLSDRVSKLTVISHENNLGKPVEKTYVNGIASSTLTFSDYLQEDATTFNYGDKIYFTSNFAATADPNGYRSTKVLVNDYNTNIWDTLGIATEEILLLNNSFVSQFSSAYNDISQRFVTGYYNDGLYKFDVYNTIVDSLTLIATDSIICPYDASLKPMYKEFSLEDENYDSLKIIDVYPLDAAILGVNDISWTTTSKIGKRTYFDIKCRNAQPGSTNIKFTVYDGYDTTIFYKTYTFTEVTVNSTSTDYTCGDEAADVSASPSIGNIRWYTEYDDVTEVHTGTSYTTGTLTGDTTIYMEAFNGSCISNYRDSVVITHRTIPVIDSYTNGSACGTSNVNLNATSSSGTIYWYSASTGGTFLGTGTNYSSPLISSNTTYYAESYDNYCGSVRQSVTATINAIPLFTSITDGSRCGSGTIAFSASTGDGTIYWYDTIVGGINLGTGNNFTTPVLNATDTFYVEIIGTTCSSQRFQVIGTVNSAPTFTSKTPATRCGPGSLSLGATASSGNISWYTSKTGGTPIGSGTSFSTPIITTNKLYYIEITDGLCTTSRDSVLATITTTPTITLGTVSNPTACSGTDGSIQITGTGTGDVTWSGTASGSATATTLPYTLSSLSAGTYNFTFDDGCVSNTVSATITDPGAPAAPTITASGATTFCSGGSVTLTSSSAVNNVWSNGATTQTITVSASGSYSVDVTTAGCTSSSAATAVTVNTAPTIALGTVSNPSACSGTDGSIQITGTGTGDVTWSGTASGSATATTLPYTLTSLAAGTYNFTFDVGCLSNTVSATITDPGAPAAPTITASGATTFCSGGSVTLTSSSAVNNVWSNGATTQTITVSTSGSYSVDVTTAGCTSSSVATAVTVNTAPSIALGTVSNPTACSGTDGSIQITGTGMGDVTWSGTASGSATATTLPYTLSSLAAGTYNFTFDVGCLSNTVSATITDPGAPAAPTITA